ncbi:hypothetical protein GQ457_18G008160 [Hibiscus cannabinus]
MVGGVQTRTQQDIAKLQSDFQELEERLEDKIDKTIANKFQDIRVEVDAARQEMVEVKALFEAAFWQNMYFKRDFGCRTDREELPMLSVVETLTAEGLDNALSGFHLPIQVLFQLPKVKASSPSDPNLNLAPKVIRKPNSNLENIVDPVTSIWIDNLKLNPNRNVKLNMNMGFRNPSNVELIENNTSLGGYRLRDLDKEKVDASRQLRVSIGHEFCIFASKVFKSLDVIIKNRFWELNDLCPYHNSNIDKLIREIFDLGGWFVDVFIKPSPTRMSKVIKLKRTVIDIWSNHLKDLIDSSSVFIFVSWLLSLILEEKNFLYREVLMQAEVNLNLVFDVCADNALIDMYSKCGYRDNAWVVLKVMDNRSIVSWTKMAMKCTQNGQVREAFNIIDEMVAKELCAYMIQFHGHVGSGVESLETYLVKS